MRWGVFISCQLISINWLSLELLVFIIVSYLLNYCEPNWKFKFLLCPGSLCYTLLPGAPLSSHKALMTHSYSMQGSRQKKKKKVFSKLQFLHKISSPLFMVTLFLRNFFNVSYIQGVPDQMTLLWSLITFLLKSKRYNQLTFNSYGIYSLVKHIFILIASLMKTSSKHFHYLCLFVYTS